jgi:hypothetical protein
LIIAQTRRRLPFFFCCFCCCSFVLDPVTGLGLDLLLAHKGALAKQVGAHELDIIMESERVACHHQVLSFAVKHSQHMHGALEEAAPSTASLNVKSAAAFRQLHS